MESRFPNQTGLLEGLHGSRISFEGVEEWKYFVRTYSEHLCIREPLDVTVSKGYASMAE